MAGGDGIFKEGANGETSGGLAEAVAVNLEEAMIEREAEPEGKKRVARVNACKRVAAGVDGGRRGPMAGR